MNMLYNPYGWRKQMLPRILLKELWISSFLGTSDTKITEFHEESEFPGPEARGPIFLRCFFNEFRSGLKSVWSRFFYDFPLNV